MLAKLKPVPKAEVDEELGPEPKIDVDGDEPNPRELVAPKREGEVLAPNAETEAPNMEGVGAGVEVVPKGFELDGVAKGEELNDGVVEDPNVEPKPGVLGANGLEAVVDVKGLDDA